MNHRLGSTPFRIQSYSKYSIISALDPAIFACISMLARAVKDTIKHEMSSMLEAMLSVDLSPSLTTALYELAAHIPAFKKDIAEGLLKILSMILMQQPFRHPGTPRQFLSPVHPAVSNVGGGGPGDSNPPESAAVVLVIILDITIRGSHLNTVGSQL